MHGVWEFEVGTFVLYAQLGYVGPEIYSAISSFTFSLLTRHLRMLRRLDQSPHTPN